MLLTPIITVATETVDTLLAYSGQLFTDTTPFIALAMGLAVAFWVINRVIGIVTRRTREGGRRG